MAILKFKTPSCGQCMLVDARLRNAFLKFNDIDCTTTEGEAMAKQYNVMHVPTVIMTDGEGNIVNRYDTVPEIMKAISTGALKK